MSTGSAPGYEDPRERKRARSVLSSQTRRQPAAQPLHVLALEESAATLQMRREAGVLIATATGVYTVQAALDLHRAMRWAVEREPACAVVLDLTACVLGIEDEQWPGVAHGNAAQPIDLPGAVVVRPAWREAVQRHSARMARYGLERVVTSSLDVALLWASGVGDLAWQATQVAALA
jgi:hypothetical protein